MKLLKAIVLLTFMSCFASYSQNIVHIPNVFTPNGDGVNDVFRVTTSDYEELTVTIYNRYGETVYRFQGLNGSWDGYTHAGVRVSPGTYYVFVEASNGGGDPETDQETLQVHY